MPGLRPGLRSATEDPARRHPNPPRARRPIEAMGTVVADRPLGTGVFGFNTGGVKEKPGRIDR